MIHGIKLMQGDVLGETFRKKLHQKTHGQPQLQREQFDYYWPVQRKKMS